MKAFKAIYKHGHFIDQETGLRLVPVQGAEYTISAEDKAFKTEDSKLEIKASLDSTEKLKLVKNEFGVGRYHKIMNAGEQLFFRIGINRKVEGDESRQYIFVCNLLEDLYLAVQNNKKGEERTDWALVECNCVLEDCLLGGMTLTGKINATSLNQLFAYTVIFYFQLQRGATASAFNTFFKYYPGMNVNFDAAKKQRYESLGKMREVYFSSKKME